VYVLVFINYLVAIIKVKKIRV